MKTFLKVGIIFVSTLIALDYYLSEKSLYF